MNYSYTWDNANRLGAIYQGSGSCASSGGSAVGLSYDGSNRCTQLTLPNGVTVAYNYDTDSLVTGLAYSAGSTQLGNLTYIYDATGRRTAIGGSLAAATLPSNVSGGASTTYNRDNAATKFNGTSLNYTVNSNLLGDATNTYTSDPRNHLNQIASGVSASFTYDPFGRRTEKTVSSVVIQYLYDGFNPVQELGAGGSPTVKANLLTGLGIDEYFARTDASGNVSSFLRDALGSTVGWSGRGKPSRRIVPISRSVQPRSAGRPTATSMISPAARTTPRDCTFIGRDTTARRIKDLSRKIRWICVVEP